MHALSFVNRNERSRREMLRTIDVGSIERRSFGRVVGEGLLNASPARAVPRSMPPRGRRHRPEEAGVGRSTYSIAVPPLFRTGRQAARARLGYGVLEPFTECQITRLSRSPGALSGSEKSIAIDAKASFRSSPFSEATGPFISLSGMVFGSASNGAVFCSLENDKDIGRAARSN